MGTTFRGWSSTLAARVRLVISRLVLIFALPLDFHGGVRVFQGLCIFLLHCMVLRLLFLPLTACAQLRSSTQKVVWSRRQPLANVGAVLSLLDGPTGCDPAFCVVWFRFRLLRRYLALWPTEVGRVCRLLEMDGDGCPGHGPIHLLSSSAAEIGFRWNPDALAWVRPGLPMLSNIAGPIQHFKTAILDAWRNKVAVDLCVAGRVFVVGPCWILHGSLQLLNSSHVRERDKGLLRSILVGGVWNGFLLGRVRGQAVPCRFCGAPGGDGHLFWECTFPPLVEIRENPEFHDLMRMDKVHWPRCLLWHGWLPMLSGGEWCFSFGLVMLLESASYLVETALGGYFSRLITEWSPPDGYDQVANSSLVPVHPNVWSGGSIVLDKVTGISSSGAGFFADQSGDLFGIIVAVGSRFILSALWVMFSPVEVSVLFQGLFSLSRGLKCGESFWLYSLLVLFIWVLTILVLFVMLVVCLMVILVTIPFELVKDGDLLLLINRMLASSRS